MVGLEERISATLEHELMQVRSATLHLSRQVEGLTQRLAQMEENLGNDVLDALVQVSQHLEAVQAASSWALLGALTHSPGNETEQSS